MKRIFSITMLLLMFATTVVLCGCGEGNTKTGGGGKQQSYDPKTGQYN